MTYTSFKAYFKYTSSQRSGIYAFLSIIIIIELLHYFVDLTPADRPSKQELEWLSVQKEMDALKRDKIVYVQKITPFNPNFITDFKGSKLGMSVKEIDRLLAYRKSNQYVNSAREFQQITKVSDSLLRIISPNFKFPEWVNHKREFKIYPKQTFEKKPATVLIDINQATQEDLIKIYGIGEGLSARILKEKEKFGGFVSMEQMKDVWGLSPEVIEKLNEHFNVSNFPQVKKLNINSASIKELLQFPYFKYPLAKSIVTYRSMNGKIQGSADLIKIKDFPVDKINIIALYLEF